MPPNPTVLYGGLATPLRGNVDRSILSMSGASQTLVPLVEYQTALRKRLIFKCGATAATICLNGTTASVGGPACITLQPNEGLSLVGDDCPKTAITVIGTAAAAISCIEGF